MKVAVLGTGTMGAGMARSCAREGLDVVAWNRTRSKAEPLADDGIAIADTVADAVRGADVVVTMLFDVDSVLEHLDDLVGNLGDDAVWLQSSTVGPPGIARIADAAPDDTPLLDAPMLGTKKPAEDGKLVPLVSGSHDLIEKARPVLDAVGAKTVEAGDELGQASALKLACNAWILSITAATAQSVALTQQQGLDGHLFLQAIEGGAADSPYAQLKGPAMLDGDFTPSFEVDGGRKDASLIADAIRSAGVTTDLFDQVKAMFDRASEDGHGDDDLAAVFSAF
ncbi:NAD(P)-dependent oxidoreductase [Jatrophihabitans endophyticus]|uniref:NAD(P)-dependent oxidoreductase n=1 Tax=Jatrophihabitans endophyticus TaxID=1206085 RepID=UPI0019DBD621|nr:NAD(P)-dependent oxidoreductase [Jatrophihabitans endophyticus]MBE7188126.1 NAD(P)-dependent oxidoreductase [Jatrophihabitans endophyticus]